MPAAFSSIFRSKFDTLCEKLHDEWVIDRDKIGGNLTHRIPATIPLKPAPIHTTFIDLYSSIEKLPVSNPWLPVLTLPAMLEVNLDPLASGLSGGKTGSRVGTYGW